MPSEESRRLLKLFGIAVTDLEVAVEKGAAKDGLTSALAEVDKRLREVQELIERLRARAR
jgi:hypothetical protein